MAATYKVCLFNELRIWGSSCRRCCKPKRHGRAWRAASRTARRIEKNEFKKTLSSLVLE